MCEVVVRERTAIVVIPRIATGRETGSEIITIVVVARTTVTS